MALTEKPVLFHCGAVYCLQFITAVCCFQDIVQQGQLRLSAVSDLSKTAVKNTTDDGCRAVDAELQQLDNDYNDLKLSTQIAKEKVKKKLQDWIDLWKKAEGLSTWVRDTELTLGSQQNYGADLVEKKLLLEQLKVLQMLLLILPIILYTV